MWNLASSNKLCSDKFTIQVSNLQFLISIKILISFEIQSHQKHLNNIANVRPSINNKPPKQPEFLKNRQKQEKMKERNLKILQIRNQYTLERASLIHYENKKLLSKMMEIERKPSLLNPLNLTKSTFQIPSKTLNGESRIRGLRKINSENLVKNPILT